MDDWNWTVDIFVGVWKKYSILDLKILLQLIGYVTMSHTQVEGLHKQQVQLYKV